MALVVKNPLASAEDTGCVGLIPGSGRPPGGEHGNPLQYSCLENPHGQRSGQQSMGSQKFGQNNRSDLAHMQLNSYGLS